MKICWLQQKLGAFGGAEGNVLSTAMALQARGCENILLYHERTGLDEERWNQAFARTVQVADGTDILDAVRGVSPDVIWIHNWNNSSDFPRLRELGIPMGRMVHDHALYCLRHYKYHPLTRKNCERPASAACIFPCLATIQRGSGKWPVRFASLGAKLREIADNRGLDRLVVASHFMRGELAKNRFAEEKIRILPPVPPDPPDAGSASPDGFEPGRLLFVGQVIRGKGVDLLIRALSGLEGDWRFALAGRGSALNKCRALIEKLGLSPRVEIFGHLSPAELARQYRLAQIVVVPSAWQEPFGMVGIEAMRHARSVVAFDVGGIPDWLHDQQNGELVPAGNVDALRQSLQRLLGDPGRCRQMGARGLLMTSQIFSFEKYVDSLLLMLEELSGLPTPRESGPAGLQALRTHA
ncbi:MAG: glycosyltransferase family 4 protein [Terrimicrobiaceae bacterium]